jgi:hypothetical protein
VCEKINFTIFLGDFASLRESLFRDQRQPLRTKNSNEKPNQMTAAKKLKAGTETGSLMNHIISGCRMAAPEVGMGGTILGWTDRRACTITQVSKSGKRVGIVEDIATRIDKNGMSDSQEYSFERGSGSPTFFTLRKNGAWVRQGESIRGQRLAIGKRDHYYDFSF